MNSAAQKWGVGLVVVVALLAATTADARIKYRDLQDPGRDYTQRGFQLYLGVGGQGYEIEDHDYDFLRDNESEGLVFVGAALGLDRDLALYIEAAGSEHETPVGPVDFGYAHLGLKYAFKTGFRNQWQPYGKASIGAILLDEKLYDHHVCDCDDDFTGYVGPSFGLGFGVDRFISRRAALFGEVGFLFGRFDKRVVHGEEFDLYDDVGVTSGRVQFGLRLRL